MDVVKNFIGWSFCFAIAFAVIVCWPLLKRVGNGLEAGVNNLDFAITVAGYERRQKRSGLGENFDDPQNTQFRSEAAAVREETGALNCENLDGDRWCQAYEYEHGCWYDGDLSLYWCLRP